MNINFSEFDLKKIIYKELQEKLSLKIKISLITEWIELISDENYQININYIINYLLRKEVHLSDLIEGENNFNYTIINNEYEIYELNQNYLFEILEIENISESHEFRDIDSDKRTLRLKLTDGRKIYYALEETKIDLQKYYKYNIQKIPNLNLSILKNTKLLIKSGCIMRRNILLLKSSFASIIDSYEELNSFLEKRIDNTKIEIKVPNLNENSQNQDKDQLEIDEKMIIEEFMQYIDEL